MESQNKFKKIIISLVAVLSILGIAFFLTKNKDEIANKETNTDTTVTKQEDPAPADNTGTVGKKTVYKSGTYTSKGEYTSPAGKEEVTVTVTLLNDVITTATFSADSSNPVSKNLQDKFAAGFSQEVVGKNIDEVALTVINGSSLTPKGFMDALAKIKLEAKA